MFNITTDTSNKDAIFTKKEYLDMIIGFQSKISEPIVEEWNDRYIFRGDLSSTSLKGYGAEPLIASINNNVLVYCAPRAGAAANAIASVAQLYGKKCVFFCPASKIASDQQLSLMNFKNVELRFVKVAAMPVLNYYAKKWAKEKKAEFLPFGLSGISMVTAGLIHVSNRMKLNPTEVWMSVSTGTAIRAFEIAWPLAKIKGIVVARNMKPGEIGKSDLQSATIPFLKPAKNLPHFPTTTAYDGKAWERFKLESKPGAIFINVSCDANISIPYNEPVNSYREWYDFKDLA
jgi:hypothetical protein